MNILKRILVLWLVFLAVVVTAQTHVRFDLAAPYFNANPASNRVVTLQPLTPFPGNLITYTSSVAGIFYHSNAYIGDYSGVVKAKGQAAQIPFQITVTATNLGVIDADDITSVLGQQSYPSAGKSSWSIQSADQRFLFTPTNAATAEDGQILAITGDKTKYIDVAAGSTTYNLINSTNLPATSIRPGTAGIDISGNAATATFASNAIDVAGSASISIETNLLLRTPSLTTAVTNAWRLDATNAALLAAQNATNAAALAINLELTARTNQTSLSNVLRTSFADINASSSTEWITNALASKTGTNEIRAVIHTNTANVLAGAVITATNALVAPTVYANAIESTNASSLTITAGGDTLTLGSDAATYNGSSGFVGVGSSLTVDASGFNGNLTTGDNTVQEIAQKLDDLVASGADLSAIDFLVGTASGLLSGEIAVGITPGGELGGTWASPTIDDGVTVTSWALGASTATTPTSGDNDTSLATTAFVQTELVAATNGLPALLSAKAGTNETRALIHTNAANIFAGEGSGLTNLNASELRSGTVAAARLPANTVSSDGIVTSGSGQISKVWKTDGSGNPSWQDDALGEPGGGIGTLNGLTADPQSFSVVRTLNDAQIVSATSTHTFHFPYAGANTNGLLHTNDWAVFSAKASAQSVIDATNSARLAIQLELTARTNQVSLSNVLRTSFADISVTGGGGTTNLLGVLVEGSNAGGQSATNFNTVITTNVLGVGKAAYFTNLTPTRIAFVGSGKDLTNSADLIFNAAAKRFVSGNNNSAKDDATGTDSAIVGGQDNYLGGSTEDVAILGGTWNRIGVANHPTGGGGYSSVILGGQGNLISGSNDVVAPLFMSYNSIILGGQSNIVTRNLGTAGGRGALSDHVSAWVWSDSTTDTNFYSTGSNQFLVKATGGVGINTNNPRGYSMAIHGNVYHQGTNSMMGAHIFNGAASAGVLRIDEDSDDGANYLAQTIAPLAGNRTITWRDASGTPMLSGDTFTGDVTATIDTDGGTALTIADSVAVTGWTLGASIATTPSSGDSDTSLATTAFVQTELAAATNGLPALLAAKSGTNETRAIIFTNAANRIATSVLTNAATTAALVYADANGGYGEATVANVYGLWTGTGTFPTRFGTNADVHLIPGSNISITTNTVGSIFTIASSGGAALEYANAQDVFVTTGNDSVILVDSGSNILATWNGAADTFLQNIAGSTLTMNSGGVQIEATDHGVSVETDGINITGTGISPSTLLGVDADSDLVSVTSLSSLNVTLLNATNVATMITNAPFLKTDANSLLAYTADGASLTNLNGSIVIAGSNVTVTTNTVAGTGQKTYTVASTGGGGDATKLMMSGGLGTDDTWAGAIITNLNAGATIAQWDAVYLGSASKWLLADANGSGTYPALGIVTSAANDTDPVTVVTHGTIRNDAWAWTPGGTLYLSLTAGGLTQTAPSTDGEILQVVGTALTADIIEVNPSSDYAELGTPAAGGTPALALVLAEGQDADGLSITNLGSPTAADDAARLADINSATNGFPALIAVKANTNAPVLYYPSIYGITTNLPYSPTVNILRTFVPQTNDYAGQLAFNEWWSYDSQTDNGEGIYSRGWNHSPTGHIDTNFHSFLENVELNWDPTLGAPNELERQIEYYLEYGPRSNGASARVFGLTMRSNLMTARFNADFFGVADPYSNVPSFSVDPDRDNDSAVMILKGIFKVRTNAANGGQIVLEGGQLQHTVPSGFTASFVTSGVDWDNGQAVRPDFFMHSTGTSKAWTTTGFTNLNLTRAALALSNGTPGRVMMFGPGNLVTNVSGTGVLLGTGDPAVAGTDYVSPSGSGAALTVDASGFDGNLTTSDNTVQEVAQKLDDLVAIGGNYLSNTLYVSFSSGNDTTALPGRRDLPYATLSNAVYAADTDDTVFVFPGRYTNSGPMMTLSNKSTSIYFLGEGMLVLTNNTEILLQQPTNHNIVHAPGWTWITQLGHAFRQAPVGQGDANIDLTVGHVKNRVNGKIAIQTDGEGTNRFTFSSIHCTGSGVGISVNNPENHMYIGTILCATGEPIQIELGRNYIYADQMTASNTVLYVYGSQSSTYTDIQVGKLESLSGNYLITGDDVGQLYITANTIIGNADYRMIDCFATNLTIRGATIINRGTGALFHGYSGNNTYLIGCRLESEGAEIEGAGTSKFYLMGTSYDPATSSGTINRLDNYFPVNANVAGTNHSHALVLTNLNQGNATVALGLDGATGRVTTNSVPGGSGDDLGDATAVDVQALFPSPILTNGHTARVFLGNGLLSTNAAATNLFAGPLISPGDGSQSFKAGEAADADGAGATAVGVGATAPGADGTAVGRNAQANNENSTALGEGTAADANLATAVGAEAGASGSSSTAIGGASSAGHGNSTALGTSATTTEANQIRLGTASENVSVPGGLRVNGTIFATNLTASQFVATDADKKLVSTLNGSTLTDLNAANLGSGIIPDARMPNLTGEVTTSEGAVATMIADSVTVTGWALGTSTADNFTAGTLTNTAGTANRMAFHDANKKIIAAAASGAVPLNADGSATTWAQINALAPAGIITNYTTQAITLTNAANAIAGVLTNAGGTAWGVAYHDSNKKITSTAAGTAGQVLISNGSAAPSYVSRTNCATFVLENPTSSDKMPGPRLQGASTIRSVTCTLIGSGSPSITYNIKYGSDLSAAGTSVTTTPSAVTSVTTGTAATINNSAVTGGDILWLANTAQSGTVNWMSVTVEYTTP